MGHSDYQQSWDFNFEGRFLGFWGHKPGKLKYLWLGFSEENVQIKLPKELRTSLRLILQPGDRVQVLGRGQLDRATGELKLKARRVISLPVESDQSSELPPSPLPQILSQVPPTVKTASVGSEAKILLCQKSKCCKKGGKQLLRSLETALRDRNLQGKVRIERTGCMKCCSSAPNLVIMPGKHRHRHLRPQLIPALLEKHYGHL
ncbi:MAG: (2Fe-2S) ferredoxin domain-containing protein [Leptolyngbyaceae cyanobacterium MO_188.B28]|nr:(2Fe-2S) ferredoxin domain-containing protein [Leptolyngbyaceae cyanobacterium MO_188.B28]